MHEALNKYETRETEREVSSVMRFKGFVHCMLAGQFGWLEGLAC